MVKQICKVVSWAYICAFDFNLLVGDNPMFIYVCFFELLLRRRLRNSRQYLKHAKTEGNPTLTFGRDSEPFCLLKVLRCGALSEKTRGETLLASALPLPLSWGFDIPISDVGGVGEERDLGVLIECDRFSGELNEESAISSSESTLLARRLAFLKLPTSGEGEGDVVNVDAGSG